MATMFRDFSFNPVSPPAYSVYEAERAAMNVSPTSSAMDPLQLSRRPPTPPCTMGDLAVQLNQQSLRIDPREDEELYGPTTPPSDACTSSARMQQARPTYSRVAASVLRMQRQSSSRMQCCASHVRDISRLVSMIEEEEQCTINEASSRTSSTSSTSSESALSSCTTSGDDEGIDMDYDIPARGIEALVRMSQWRSGDHRDRCIRVTRPVRMRKRSGENGVSKRRSS
ncbi:Nn.00g074340.m01.CDS01 [Neocucurbitaria sp. VM-36]